MKIVIAKLYQILLLSICLVATSINNDCKKLAKIPYRDEFISSGYITEWAILYTAYLAKNASVDPESPEWKDLKRGVFISNPFCNMTPLGKDPKSIQDLQICLDLTTTEGSLYVPYCKTNISDAYHALTINYLEHMQAYLTSPDFAKSMKANSGIAIKSIQIHNNYTKIHLTPVLQKFSKICNISVNNQKIPSTHFDGNITDLGVIVNIINNSNQQFQVYQTTSPNEPIAHIQQGLNDVNLYTTALTQEKKSKKTMFAFFESDAKNSHTKTKEPAFSIGIYTGKELVAFLKTLPRKDAKIFTMNGCPTSEQYLANPKDSYLILSMPTRIQAINLSVFTGPYLLTMHINQEDNVLQPLFVAAQAIFQKNVIKTKENPEEYIKTEKLNRNLLPLLILPQFLWDIPMMQAFWMLHTTSYIAALTDFSCFGFDKFGSPFDYFNDLGYFDTNHKYRFVVDRYNILKPGETFFDANQLMGCALYESDLKNCSDIPKIYSALDEKNNTVTNNNTESYLNFNLTFNPKTKAAPSSSYFNKTNFNNIYNKLCHQIWPIIFNISKKVILESIFLKIDQLKTGAYLITWTDKKNNILSQQTINIDYDDYELSINTLSNIKNQETNLPDSVKFKELKIIYKKTNQKDLFEITIESPIDKLQAVYTYAIPALQIKNLYFDLYQTFNVQPYTRSTIINGGKLPDFLQNLTDENWQDGIYIVPTLSNYNTGVFSVIFYKSDKTILGSISNQEKSQFIKEPITAYNLYINDLKPMYNIYLSTGILLKSTLKT